MHNSKYEVLAPAGNLEIFKAVIAAGADAVYVGGARFGARAYADNFGEEDMLEAIDYAHLHGRKVFMTVNTLLKTPELENELFDYLKPYYMRGLDAVIVQDLGVMQFIHRNFPKLDIHASTQMTICGEESAAFLKENGVTRVVTSRELSAAEIKKIYDRTGMEIESFVHGALCYCYSGQCLMSSMLGGRSGNRGRCAQPCRLPYSVLNEKGKLIGREENYILSPKDLCTLEEIPDLLESGIYSLKIEGRMKQAEYAAGVVAFYRKYVDLYEQKGRKGFKVSKEDMKKITDLGNRSGFTKGYYHQHNGPDMMTFVSPSHAKGDEKLHREIRESFVGVELKEKINGWASLRTGTEASFTVSDEMHTVTVSGEVVQQAQKQPMTEQKIREKLEKTGNTPFEFEALEIELGNDIFMPVQAVNQLRREALEGLKLEILKEHFREEPIKVEREEKRTVKKSNDKAQVYVLLEELDGLSKVLSRGFVDGVYIDCNAWSKQELVKGLATVIGQIHSAGKWAGLAMPAVFRNNTSEFFAKIIKELETVGVDKYLIRSMDEYGFMREKNISSEKIVLDHNMYAYSDEAQEAYLELDVEHVCAPVELNRKELSHYQCGKAEFIVYGYQQLMVSAQCVHKNTEGCDSTRKVLYLKDRYGKRFRVKNCCNYCYNLFYNSTPLCLIGNSADVEKLGFMAHRLNFTFESPKQIDRILEYYEETFINKNNVVQADYIDDYTNGHFKRGVE